MRKTRRWEASSTGGILVSPPSRTKTQRRRESIESAANQLQRVSPIYESSVNKIEILFTQLRVRFADVNTIDGEQHTVQSSALRQTTGAKFDSLYKASDVVNEMIKTLETLNSQIENVINFSPKALHRSPLSERHVTSGVKSQSTLW